MNLQQLKTRLEKLEGPKGIDLAEAIREARLNFLRTGLRAGPTTAELEKIPNPSPLIERIIRARKRVGME